MASRLGIKHCWIVRGRNGLQSTWLLSMQRDSPYKGQDTWPPEDFVQAYHRFWNSDPWLKDLKITFEIRNIFQLFRYWMIRQNLQLGWPSFQCQVWLWFTDEISIIWVAHLSWIRGRERPLFGGKFDLNSWPELALVWRPSCLQFTDMSISHEFVP